MYLEAIETAKLYTTLSNKLGNDITEAIFKYIDNKTERSIEVAIKTLATKDDLSKVKFHLNMEISYAVRWMLFFWISQVGVTWVLFYVFLRK
jgi:hypothetical protein